MHETDCPTPGKRKYPTKEAAEARAAVQSTQTWPYLCSCRSWHLTMRRVADDTADPGEVARLSNLSDGDFELVVSAEVRGRATPAEAAALRTPQCAYRWHGMLKKMNASILADLAQMKGLKDEETKRRRSALVRRQGAILGRATEAKRLKDLWNIERNRPKPKLTDSEKRRRAEHRKAAGERALERLRDMHREDFDKLLQEELQAEAEHDADD